MSIEQSFLGYHADLVRKDDPSLECPVKIGRNVLDRIGVKMNDTEFEAFIGDFVADIRKTGNEVELMK